MREKRKKKGKERGGMKAYGKRNGEDVQLARGKEQGAWNGPDLPSTCSGGKEPQATA